MSGRLDRYLDELREAFARLDRAAVQGLVREILATRRRGGAIHLFGNGGSAALATHMACDLANLPAPPGLAPLRARSLVDNVPTLTALANDTGYDNIFAAQLEGRCRSSDLLVAVSCSGESANVVEAVRVGRAAGARIAALTGESGGRLAGLADLCLRAPVGEVWQQEDVHLAVEHAVAHLLRQIGAEVAQRMARRHRALVLCAGLGTRLGELGRDRPKPMMPIAGRPALEHTLLWLRRHGIRDVAINLHHRGEAITGHFGAGEGLGVRLVYAHEGELLGTAGAIANLDGFLDGSPLVVVYGDVLTDLDLRAFLAAHHEKAVLEPATAASLAVHPVPDPCSASLVGLEADDRVSLFVEKPPAGEVDGELGSAGVVVLEPEAIGRIPRGCPSDLGADLFPALLDGGLPIYGWRLPERTYLIDFGTPESYAKASREWPALLAR